MIDEKPPKYSTTQDPKNAEIIIFNERTYMDLYYTQIHAIPSVGIYANY